MDEKQALATLQKRYKKQNDYNKTKYDRVNVMLPTGTKNRIQETGQSMNGFIVAAVLQALEEYEAAAAPVSIDHEQETISSATMAAYMAPPETKEEQPETAAPLASDVARLRAIAEQAKRNNQELRNE